ncbi:FecR family protein [Nisaea nitritireducens]|uniref:FecR family protein n=1 Tax=Nisaea nitritireducens TaxID=568392 RepID=UPI0018669D1A|nr:FecR domain-containing protein [Nisaea nitritireducens]
MQQDKDAPDRAMRGAGKRSPEDTTSGHDDDQLDAATDWLLQLRASPDDADLHSAFTRWLSASELHGAAFRRAEKVWHLSGSVTPAFSGIWDGHAGTAGDSAPAATVTTLRPRRSRPGRRAVIAGGLAACIALIFFTVAPPPEYADADLSSGVAEVTRYDLADGSQVTLNAGSALKTALTGQVRQVTILAGEAYFAVRPDPKRPFKVLAGDTVVTVTGTEFGTRLADRIVTVEVEGGRVKVASGTSGKKAPIATLARGDRLYLERGTSETMQTKVPVSHIAAWRRGLLIADKESIHDLVERIKPYYPGRIFLTPGGLAGKRVSGVFDLSKPVEALRAAVHPHGASVHEIPSLLAVVTPG